MLSIPFTVRRSIEIDKPPDSIFTSISDFNTWRSWSPWLSQEPECPVEIGGVPGKPGHKQSWDGKKIGSGHMELSTVVPGQTLEYDLSFVKPWKSQSKAAFEFEQEGQATRVTWSMEGTLPIFLFFMKKKMSAMVAKDYERGLAMLKKLLEAET
ncbi:SRPBCC family protein [Marinobacter sp. X15-166B]|uniref:SRPBCC family protein n=1 Tax=Marinobacter sp. X15-166B TaxID=1897620 RepID=UPI00085CA216|nr:SRPBCC family protein [Marinobacter sp. X15-166B]OEY67515.1 hypothetical protein BG841_14455 [Marinobacter sp. X15-166B]